MNVPDSISSLPGKRSVQYLLFWVASFVFLVNYFTKGSDIGTIDIIYTLLFHISLVFAVSMNSFLLIPRYLARRRYLLYFAGLGVVLSAAVWLNIFTYRYLSDWLFPGYYFISYLQWWEILEFMIVYTGLTSLLEFSKSWFRELELEKKMETLQKEKMETELKALKAQINPHFLFNSLNHIYALATRKAEETGPAVLQLSDLLRYALKKMEKEKVPLNDEIDYLREYIELYKSRVLHPERIHVEIEGDPGKWAIAPLLLVVFVENCFKHGSIKQPGEHIHIKLEIKEGQLIFSTSNTIDSGRELPLEESGLGIENARKRLNLLYPGNYRLELGHTDRTFNTHLELNLI